MDRRIDMRVAQAYLERRQGEKGRSKVAGEVVFRKDMSNDENAWAFGGVGPSERKIVPDFNYSPKNVKPLAKVMKSTLAALGHVISAYHDFAKIKSAKVSPDGALGGKGYIQEIQAMRKQYMNCVEALSALSDTLYDETNAPHWSVLSRQEDAEDKEEVRELLQDAEEIREDPQEWADQQMDEEFGKQARAKKASIADLYFQPDGEEWIK